MTRSPSSSAGRVRSSIPWWRCGWSSWCSRASWWWATARSTQYARPANTALRSRFPAMAELTVYEKPTCTTCRRLGELLQQRGIEFERVDYHIDPLPEEKIRDLLRKAGVGPRDVLRKKEPIYNELRLDSPDVSDDELIRLMVKHPQLLERPVVERGDRAVLARPPERVLEILD